MSKRSNVTDLRSRKWFIYDAAAQRELSSYNKLLIETAITNPVWEYSPDTYCVISTSPAMCWHPQVMWDVDTDDHDALIQLIGHLEMVKAYALEQIKRIDERDEAEEGQ